jgi:hypothetical protein
MQSDRDEYVTIAAGLAVHGGRSVEQRRAMRNQVLSSALCDGPRLTGEPE